MVEIDDDSDEPPIFSWVLNLKIPTAACATDEGPLEIWTPSGPPKTGERKAGDKKSAPGERSPRNPALQSYQVGNRCYSLLRVFFYMKCP